MTTFFAEDQVSTAAVTQRTILNRRPARAAILAVYPGSLQVRLDGFPSITDLLLFFKY